MLFIWESKMRKKILKTIVIGITLLFTGLALQPTVSTIELEKNESEPKEYLFETIIDIANNPDINRLLTQINDDYNNKNYYIKWDFDSRDIFQKILLKKPNLLLSMIFTKTRITPSYLESSYNKGCEVTKVLGEEKVINIVESVEITNPQILDELNSYIMNNEELYEKITTLEKMNEKIDTSLPFRNYSLICKILLILFYTYIIRCGIVNLFSNFFTGKPILSVIFDLLWFKNWELAGVCMVIFQVIYDTIGCEKPAPSNNSST